MISSLYVKPFGRNYGNPPENIDPRIPRYSSLQPILIDRLPLRLPVSDP